MALSQGQIFAMDEGDAWFARHREKFADFDPGEDWVLKLLAMYGVVPHRALELGACNGHRLAALHARHGTECIGIDVSAAAIADGRKRYPAISFAQGSIENADAVGRFDLVIVHFVLHWVERNALDAALQNLANALTPSGLLVIGDFLPDEPADVPYHHRTDVQLWTYKRDYGAVLLARDDFRLIGMQTGHHDRLRPEVNVASDDRVALWLLEKQPA